MQNRMKEFLETVSYGATNSSDAKFRKIRNGVKEAVVIGYNGWSVNWIKYWMQTGIPIKAIVNIENPSQIGGGARLH